MRGNRILAIAPSRMQLLADQTACTVTLGLWDGSSALVPHVMYPRQSEIMEVLELAATLGIHAMNIGVPILAKLASPPPEPPS